MEKNEFKESNVNRVKELVDNEGYVDLGFARGNNTFTHVNIPGTRYEDFDCSDFVGQYSDVVTIDHTHKEIMHVNTQ